MNERIINLLRLCMEAQEKGLQISFDKTNNITMIWHFDNEIEVTNYLYADTDAEMTAAEQYLKGLIADVHT